MAISKYETKINIMDSDINNVNIEKWFNRKGFDRIEFENKKQYISTDYLAEPMAFKLTQYENFDTYYKSTFGGSILVFECKLEDDKIKYNCYSPIWLFRIWTMKLKFKEKPTYFFKYLKEGHKIKNEFEHYINKVLPTQRE